MLVESGFAVNRDDPTPLHHQVRRALLNLIHDNQLKPGDRLPSEEELCRIMGVSRQTLRQAVNHLAGEGVVRRERPKGTFVSRVPIGGDLRVHLSIFEELRRLNVTPGAILIGGGVSPCPEDVAPMLDISPGSPALYLERVYTADGAPLAFSVTYFRSPEFDWLLGEDLTKSWYEMVGAKLGIVIDHVYQVMRASSATEEQARHLDVSPGFPVLVSSRQICTASGRPISYGHNYYRSDRYQFSVVLRRDRRR